MELELTYPNLLGQAFSMSEDKITEIKETIKHYKRLNMPKELIEKARIGAVAVLLKTFDLQMLRGNKTYASDNWQVFKVEENGTDDRDLLRWGDNDTTRWGTWWKLSKLKDFDKPVPFEILERLPNTASENAWVFHPESAPDPILVYPLMFKTLGVRKISAPTWYNKNVKRLIETYDFPGPYFAGVYKWE